MQWWIDNTYNLPNCAMFKKIPAFNCWILLERKDLKASKNQMTSQLTNGLSIVLQGIYPRKYDIQDINVNCY